ncbi:hypothetical protein SKAU_G00384550 [Synaphobranchus kaupii]|uniref:Uncharacterized protein n=1 Tax=Synaphobranchus kaupii TaxID=118154 RepID=A0A9Q1EEC3_SYNKA|nr:hypothetical protein SKAU_G00384550 [Synaphobranchus kaupii]
MASVHHTVWCYTLVVIEFPAQPPWLGGTAAQKRLQSPGKAGSQNCCGCMGHHKSLLSPEGTSPKGKTNCRMSGAWHVLRLYFTSFCHFNELAIRSRFFLRPLKMMEKQRPSTWSSVYFWSPSDCRPARTAWMSSMETANEIREPPRQGRGPPPHPRPAPGSGFKGAQEGSGGDRDRERERERGRAGERNGE